MNEELQRKLLRTMRRCGHFLYHYAGGKNGQRRVLAAVSRETGIPQRQLQEKLDIRSASLSELLGKLEGEGHIRKERWEEDRRQYRLELTDSGRKELTRMEEQYGQLTQHIFEKLTEEEQETLLKLLDKLKEDWYSGRLAPYLPEGGREG